MPPKPNLPNSAAEDAVFENLGLSRDDLGIDTFDDLGSGNEDDLGQDDLQGQQDQDDQGDQDDLGDDLSGDQGRVTHTTRQRPTRPIPRAAEVKADKRGNLVDANGKVIARAGKEARLYQDLHRTRGQAQTLQGQVTDLNSRLQRAVQIGQELGQELNRVRGQAAGNVEAIRQLGLDQAEQLSAMRLFKQLKDDPAKAIKGILTRAAANGINVAELGQTGGVDAKALVDLIREQLGTALKPLKDRTEAEQRTAEQTRLTEQLRGEVATEINGFFQQNPEAREYIPVFQQTLQKFPKMTLGEIWANIQLYFAKNPQQRRDQNSRGRSSRRSLPSGRGSPMVGDSDMAPVTDSFDSIVNDVLDKAGIAR